MALGYANDVRALPRDVYDSLRDVFGGWAARRSWAMGLRRHGAFADNRVTKPAPSMQAWASLTSHLPTLHVYVLTHAPSITAH